MKYGMNLLLWTTHVTTEHFPLFAKLKAAGFDGVEIPLFEGEAKHYRTIAAELKKQGLGATTVTVVGPDSNPIRVKSGSKTCGLNTSTPVSGWDAAAVISQPPYEQRNTGSDPRWGQPRS